MRAAALPMLLRMRGGAIAAAAASAVPDTAVQAPITQVALYVGTLMGSLSGCAARERHARLLPLLPRSDSTIAGAALATGAPSPQRHRCITAGTKEMDLLGCIVVGLVAASGGGTIRDVLLNRPPYWIQYHQHLHISIWTSTLTFLIWPAIVARGFKDTHLAFLWSDALAMAGSVVIGTHIGLQDTNDPLIAVLSGLCTAVFGGIGRDLLCQASAMMAAAVRREPRARARAACTRVAHHHRTLAPPAEPFC
eukprot:2322341-Prymnesium_polylepis.2